MTSFSHPNSDLTLDWTNQGRTGGIKRGSCVSPIFNTSEITAKNITVKATEQGNQWNDKGIIYDQKNIPNGKITASDTIKIETYDDAIYMSAGAPHKVDISGFKKLILTSAGNPESGSSGHAIMNNGTGNF